MTNLIARYRLPVSSLWLAVLISFYATVFLNAHLWSELYQSQAGFPASAKWTFLISASFEIWAIQVILLSWLFWGRAAKPVALIILLISIAASYFSDIYRIFYDIRMIQNIFETNHLETRELLTTSMAFAYLKHLPFLIFLIFFVDIEESKAIRNILEKIAFIVAFLLISTIILATNFKNFSSTLRNHREVRHLVIPTSTLLATSRVLIGKAHSTPEKKYEIDANATLAPDAKQKNILVVLVVGETVRAQNWGLSGYQRNTTPELSKLPVINYPHAIACGTSTKVSLPCMMSVRGRADYQEDGINNTESVLNLLDKLEVSVTWIDNQSGCKGTCDKLAFHYAKEFDDGEFCREGQNCYDEILVRAMQKTMNKQAGRQMIVLHQMGNHGPAYHERYPPSHERFSPACNTSDLTKCSNSEIVNAYDNAVLYTDTVLAKMIAGLSAIDDREVYFIYLSDHGESLGENNIYLHGLPNAIAPDYQTHVPMVMHLSGSAKSYIGCTQKNAKNPVSHDHLYHTLLGIFGVNSKTFNPELDLLKYCHVEQK